MTSMLPAAMYSCGIRMRDAVSRVPICGDRFAERFADRRIDQVVEFFREYPRWHPAPLLRHRVIDDLVREQLAADPATVVVGIGGGFDTRSFRMAGGRWLEIDEPVIAAHKDDRLPPGECPNPLRRIPWGEAWESMAEAVGLAATDQPVLFVVEGLWGHLSEAEIQVITGSVASAPGKVTVIGDFMTRAFFARHARPIFERFRALGAPFAPPPADPTLVWETAGFQLGTVISIAERAIDLGVLRMTRFGLRSYAKTLHQGLSVGVLRPRQVATTFAGDPEARAPGPV